MTVRQQRNLDRATGKRLRALRNSKGVKAQFVADELDIYSGHLSELEAGKRHWTPERIEAYEKAIGVSPNAPLETAASMLKGMK